ncbi:hypothetical protein N7478_002861 [Penicillium angulare]|uniref:uncharacterized protein n=1 Tax=Penicillium angulare TaxID=116970 RepID=UPI0025421C8D|nr:uncharacterized protein N7478_002861 [Penicillium angulare]KAJ5287175.1 hypothetical protein N7478_002861 [Penicillium angulare]
MSLDIIMRSPSTSSFGFGSWNAFESLVSSWRQGCVGRSVGRPAGPTTTGTTTITTRREYSHSHWLPTGKRERARLSASPLEKGWGAGK